MIDKARLLADLKPVIKALESDLLRRAEQEPEFAIPLKAEWQQAHDTERTAATYQSWLDGDLTQAAAAWVLGTVFLRFCEDNGLIDLPYLAGPDDRLAIAAERQQGFFETNPHETDRDWIIAGFDDMAKASPVAAGLFDRAHNPMWRITPSHQAAKDLLAFWRTPGAGTTVEHNFTDPGWDTRFLGDLYQDLSEHARSTYALLQTPDFVQEFILDLTLDPAIDEFGLEPGPPQARPDLPNTLRVIDPTCGSGHFLLGAFRRLNERWQEHAPAMDPWTRITRILAGLHGVDKNPFAASIARFRLLLAAMKAADVRRLADVHDFPLNIAVGDSLLHGRGAVGEQGELFGETGIFSYHSEDVSNYIRSADILGLNSYHVVVGNPPYITVKDERENDNYRAAYRRVCAGKYALSVPFADRFFQFAVYGELNRRSAGYVGQITANSFMKNEFGKKLVEEFFAGRVTLTHIIDTSGLIIPGHGTPTVILAGRNSRQSGNSVRVVQSVQGQPPGWEDPAKGPVWTAILDQLDKPGSESDWISVIDLQRSQMATHPWNLSGGGSGKLVDLIVRNSRNIVSDYTDRVGVFGMTNAGDVMLAPEKAWLRRTGGDNSLIAPMVVGDAVRNWSVLPGNHVFLPYNDGLNLVRLAENPSYLKWLWPSRTTIGNRATFSKLTYFAESRPWYEWHQLTIDRQVHDWTLTYAFVGTHNHFALEREGKAFNQSAPIIKLPESASDDIHFSLLGLLNSSAACFWLRQFCGAKGGSGIGRGIQAESWMERHNFNCSNVKEIPLPSELPLELGRALDETASRMSDFEPSTLCAAALPTAERFADASSEYHTARGRMIALQEELDWEVYRLYGLLSEKEGAELRADPDEVPELELGERAFEIVLARKCAAGEAETQWFARHGSTPITEIPEHWHQAYRDVVQQRIEVIERRRDIALIERPECKRRWATEPWEVKAERALAEWLLDRCERRELWFAASDTGEQQPRTLTVNQLADRLRGDAEFVSVARLYGSDDADLAEVIADIIATQHVPYLAALRYKDTGLRKRMQWEQTWELQRQEDATGERLKIPIPPKYASADFLKSSYWSNRGKLDVPKERFISYPLASPDGDGSLLLGWAGWDHREQAHALMTVIEDRTSRDGWERGRIIPLIAGLREVMPWVRQWHGEVDPAFGMSPADAYAAYLEDQMHRCQVSDADLARWRPPAAGRGRRSRAASPHPSDS